ncbi:MAG: hypothetical protein ACXWEY_09695 [Bacteroidia bacterium]
MRYAPTVAIWYNWCHCEGYKGSVSRQLKLAGFKGQVWQRNYYEHIIKTPKAYDEIADYILDNPARWKQDRFYI